MPTFILNPDKSVPLVAVDADHLRGADLRNLNLESADRQDLDMAGCDLQGRNVRGAQFMRTNLTGVDMRGLDLRGVHFHQVLIPTWSKER
jgi:uncharacterized protein YjbI with pentapeptide repeats